MLCISIRVLRNHLVLLCLFTNFILLFRTGCPLSVEMVLISMFKRLWVVVG